MNARALALSVAIVLGSIAATEARQPTLADIAESPDPLVRGMDTGKANDPEYRAAYRDCMRQRPGKGR